MQRIGVEFATRFGLQMHELIDFAKMADSLGYDSIWQADGGGQRDNFLVLAAYSFATKRIKLATGAYTVLIRSPLSIATNAATVDELSNGRVILGLGTGHPPFVENYHGMRYEKPFTRLRETIEVVKMIWKGDRVDYEGETVRCKGFRLKDSYTPLRHYIPIYVACVHERMTQLAGEVADGVLRIYDSLSYVREVAEQIKIGAERAGRSSRDIDYALILDAFVYDDWDRAMRLAKHAVAWHLQLPTFSLSATKQGYRREAQSIRKLYATGQVEDAAKQVTEEMVDDFVLAGTADDCRKKLQRWRTAGVSLPIVFPDGGLSTNARESIPKVLETFAV